MRLVIVGGTSGMGRSATSCASRSRTLPVRRMRQPEAIAQAALFSMTSPQTTGAVLEVSGGESLVGVLA
jgi:hypothetical protein